MANKTIDLVITAFIRALTTNSINFSIDWTTWCWFINLTTLLQKSITLLLNLTTLLNNLITFYGFDDWIRWLHWWMWEIIGKLIESSQILWARWWALQLHDVSFNFIASTWRLSSVRPVSVKLIACHLPASFRRSSDWSPVQCFIPRPMICIMYSLSRPRLLISAQHIYANSLQRLKLLIYLI